MPCVSTLESLKARAMSSGVGVIVSFVPPSADILSRMFVGMTDASAPSSRKAGYWLPWISIRMRPSPRLPSKDDS